MIIDFSQLKLPYISREEELKSVLDIINDGFTEATYSRRQVSLLGESGVGKTRFIKEVIQKIYSTNESKFNCIYLDTFSNTNDPLKSNLFFQFMLNTAWSEKEYISEDITYLNKKSSFRWFLSNRENSKSVKNSIYLALKKSIGLIPGIGEVLKELFPEELFSTSKQVQTEVDFSLLLQEYLENITENSKLILIIDNYQFVDPECKLKLKMILKRISCNIIFIPIIRISDNLNSTIMDTKSDVYFEEKSVAVIMENFGVADIEKLLINYIKEEDKITRELVLGCYKQTNGNLKEIEQFLFNLDKLNDYKIVPNQTPLISNITMLSEVKKDILILSSLFPTGIKLNYVQKIIDELFSLNSNNLDKELEFLVKYNLIYIEGTDEEFLKPAHEKVVNTISDLSSNIYLEQFINIRETCINVFNSLANETYNNSDFIFLVNSLIGIQKINELKKNIGLIFRYLDVLHTLSQFKEIIRFYEYITNNEIFDKDLLFYLPLKSINIILDAFQKTSNFKKGLELLELINSSYSSKIFKAKYSLQLYQYTEAINVLEGHLNDSKYLCTYLNALQHLRKDNEVRAIINDLHKKGFDYSDEYQIVILRNSAHLFDSSTAINNLLNCIKFFEEKEFIFGKATALNNLGLVYLTEKKYGTALNYFEQAQLIFEQIYSNEKYQPSFNSGLIYLIQGDYNVAVERMINALNSLPESLSFDRIKFQSNLILCKFLNSEVNLDEALSYFEKLYSQAIMIPDPWLTFLIKFNWGKILAFKDHYRGQRLVNEALDNYNGDNKIYGYYHKFYHVLGEVEFLLSTSPHWRY